MNDFMIEFYHPDFAKSGNSNHHVRKSKYALTFIEADSERNAEAILRKKLIDIYGDSEFKSSGEFVINSIVERP